MVSCSIFMFAAPLKISPWAARSWKCNTKHLYIARDIQYFHSLKGQENSKNRRIATAVFFRHTNVVARFLFTNETPEVQWYAQHRNAEKGQICLSKRSYISYNSIKRRFSVPAFFDGKSYLMNFSGRVPPEAKMHSFAITRRERTITSAMHLLIFNCGIAMRPSSFSSLKLLFILAFWPRYTRPAQQIILLKVYGT